MKTIPSIKLLTLRYARWLHSEIFNGHGERTTALHKHANDLKHYAEGYRYDSDAVRHICREARSVSEHIEALFRLTGHKHFDWLGIKHLADACEEMQRFDIESARMSLTCAQAHFRKPSPDEYEPPVDDSFGGRY
jgi:hypothetical protein